VSHPAFTTWHPADEPLELVEKRLHGGVADPNARAGGHIIRMARRFPWSVPRPGAHILEIGSGVGHIMEAAAEKFQPARIVGLDISEKMMEMARQRLRRDGVDDARFEFVHYDGITVPLPGRTFDYIYSVACIQHIPKPFAYNLFYEVQRLLKPGGFACLHMLAFSHLAVEPELCGRPFRAEVVKQLENAKSHWHFFYSFEELFYVLSNAVGVGLLDIQEEKGVIWACFSKEAGRKYYRQELPACVFASHQPPRSGLAERVAETGTK
jgi:ubiquinone/menaquinone biosynthesis C-methylase UbiE